MEYKFDDLISRVFPHIQGREEGLDVRQLFSYSIVHLFFDLRYFSEAEKNEDEMICQRAARGADVLLIVFFMCCGVINNSYGGYRITAQKKKAACGRARESRAEMLRSFY